jgi:hypothetical protein
MDYNQLETLIKKYWDCETSLEEEERLREWFRTHEVPERFRETAKLFSYFDEQKQKATGEHFDKHIVRNLSELKGKTVSLWQTSLRIAAGIAVVVAAIFFVREEFLETQHITAIEDPQKALEETKKALMMISKGFSTAEEQAKKINVLNEAEDKVKDKKNL